MDYSNGTVEFSHLGRYGNNLFEYFIARLYAEKHQLNLITNFGNNLHIKPPVCFGKVPENLKKYTIKDDYKSEIYKNSV